MIKKAIIPAAGFGTRSLPVTKVIPKELFPIHNKPSIQYVVEEAAAAGIEQILIIVSRSKNLIIDYFDHSLELEMFLQKANKSALMNKVKLPDVKLYYTRQPLARGLGDAVRLGREFVGDDPFAVLLPDDIVVGGGLGELIKVYEETKSHVVALKAVEEEFLKNYGVAQVKQEREDLFEVLDMIEKPQTNPPSNLAVIGRYVFNSSIMDALAEQKSGAGAEIQLTDSIKKVLESERCYGKVLTGQRYDIAMTEEYIALLRYLQDSEG